MVLERRAGGAEVHDGMLLEPTPDAVRNELIVVQRKHEKLVDAA